MKTGKEVNDMSGNVNFADFNLVDFMGNAMKNRKSVGDLRNAKHVNNGDHVSVTIESGIRNRKKWNKKCPEHQITSVYCYP